MMTKMPLKISLLTTFIALLLFAISCSTNEETTSENLVKADLSKGFQALNENCFSCHSANPNIENKVAPTAAELKMAYAENYKNEAAFAQAMVEFMQMPSAEKSKMPDAIQKFGLMPKMDFSEATIKNIAAYLYQTEIEKTDWFATSFEKEKEKYAAVEPLSYQEKGLKYAMATKAVLGKNLLNAIKTRGTENAVEFCNTKAIHLTDSMANDLKIKNIKRVSDLNRNPNNAANETELKYIVSTKTKLKNGEKPTPQVQELADKVIAYYPIVTNEMCLQCHGKKEKEINLKTQKRINLLYPEDKAVGYGENELRGIWVVEMEK